MPCYHPLDAFRSRLIDPSTGKRVITFNSRDRGLSDPIKLPCGQCVGCRLERSRQWAMRCVHEAQMFQNNCFITLTFSPEALSKRDNPMSVNVRDFQLFMKRLRKKYHGLEPVPNEEGELTWPIRFYHCGEYGEKYGRPHYHACLFNFDFPDKKLWKTTNDNRLYISESLSELWPYGFSTIGDVTFESAAYVARYIMKKINGSMADEKYYDRQTGQIIEPEYTTMSRRPGIGSTWMKKYGSDVYPHDHVVVRGTVCKPPKYYDSILEKTRPYEFDEIKNRRLTDVKKHADNNKPERLRIREHLTKTRLKLLERNLDT